MPSVSFSDNSLKYAYIIFQNSAENSEQSTKHARLTLNFDLWCSAIPPLKVYYFYFHVFVSFQNYTPLLIMLEYGVGVR